MKVWLYEETHTPDKHIFATERSARAYVAELTAWLNSEGVSGELEEGLDYYLYELEVEG